jgi:hypothetical protein
MSRARTLYSYVHRCGAVTLTRSALPQFARDLNLMAALGQVRANGDKLRLVAVRDAPRIGVAA